MCTIYKRRLAVKAKAESLLLHRFGCVLSWRKERYQRLYKTWIEDLALEVGETMDAKQKRIGHVFVWNNCRGQKIFITTSDLQAAGNALSKKIGWFSQRVQVRNGLIKQLVRENNNYKIIEIPGIYLTIKNGFGREVRDKIPTKTFNALIDEAFHLN